METIESAPSRMFLLCFSLGDERFALDASLVEEITPLVSIKKIPMAPAWVAGVIRYRGKTVPVIDLCALNLGRNAEKRLSTRIVLMHFTGHDESVHLLGLIAEQVTQTVHKNAEDFAATGVRAPAAPHLGGVAADPDGMLQWVDIDELLPDHVQSLIFQSERQASP